jgi:hypothetical protein
MESARRDNRSHRDCLIAHSICTAFSSFTDGPGLRLIHTARAAAGHRSLQGVLPNDIMPPLAYFGR